MIFLVKTALLMCILFLPSHLLAQVTISSSDMLRQIGTRQVIMQDARGSIPIDVGSAGENQVWDFREQVIGDTVLAVSEFPDPSVIPGIDRHPGSNFIQHITSPSDSGFDLFNFFQITDQFYINRGDSSRVAFGNFDTTFVSIQNDTLTTFPIAYGNNWLTTEVDTNGFYPINANISIDTTQNTVDAWGTVHLPMGDFKCLRLRQEVKIINQTIINGSVFSTNIDTYIQYNWISRDAFLVASAQSQNGETDFNFIDAQGFSRLDSLRNIATGFTDTPQAPSSFSLSQNYPNPFNPKTEIRYLLTRTGMVRLAVFSITGQRVRVLVHSRQPAGQYSVRWDGRDERNNALSSGIYFYRLQIDGRDLQTKKMTLLR